MMEGERRDLRGGRQEKRAGAGKLPFLKPSNLVRLIHYHENMIQLSPLGLTLSCNNPHMSRAGPGGDDGIRGGRFPHTVLVLMSESHES